MPFVTYAVWVPALDDVRMGLLDALIMAGSPSGKARGHLCLAVTNWERSPEAARREIGEAVAIAKNESNAIDEGLWKDVWMTYALMGDPDARLEAARALEAAFVDDSLTGFHFLRICLEKTTGKKSFLRDLWKNTRSLSQFELA